MKYPSLVNQQNIKVGVTAMSAGVGKYLDEYKKSISNLEKNGLSIIETANVRKNSNPSSDAKTRAEELDRLILDKDVDMILNASGGDFLLEMLQYVNFENIKNNPKLVMGSSDATGVLFPITTMLDIATIYGFNASSYDQENLHESQYNSIEIMKGNLIEQNSFDKYEIEKQDRTISYNLTESVFWETINGNVDIKGRIIGGCIDCIRNLIGTKYDYTKEFIEKYKEDGIIWYFDNFALNVEDFYLTLIQFKEAGWFNYTKGVVVGRVKYPSGFTDLTYQDALKKALGDIPIIFNADIGHVVPKMTIINGSIAHITSKDGKGKIELEME